MAQKADFGPQLHCLLAFFVHDTYSWGEMTLFHFWDILESLLTFYKNELGRCKDEKNELKDLFSAARHEALQETGDLGTSDACLNNWQLQWSEGKSHSQPDYI